jgi:hypothetical protein
LDFHCKLSLGLCPSNEEEKGYCLVYSMLVGSLMYVMKWSYISHVVGVVSGYMENPGKAVKPMLQYFRGMNITYNA